MSFPSFTQKAYHESYPSIIPTRPNLSAREKIVLITGAGSGIGAATAVAFAQAGARAIIVCGRRTQTLDVTKVNIDRLNLGTTVLVQKLDVVSEESVNAVFQHVYQAVGLIDVVINAAGHLAEKGSLKETSLANFWQTFDVNLKGAFLVSQAFLRHSSMDEEKDKDRVLILCSSLLAHLPVSSVVTAPASYTISKLAEARLAECLAEENRGALRVYPIHPGIVETEMSNRSLEMSPPGTRESLTWDHVELPAHFMLWLTSPLGAKIPSGKYLWVNWDVDELEARGEELKEDLHKLTITLGGWPFESVAQR